MKQINYLNSTALTPINHEPYTQHGGGGGFKKVVAVVAAVAIPFAAPAIASTIGLTSTLGSIMTATAAKVASGAIVGAGLGAIAGEVIGTGATRGALMGGISGGVGGYFRGSMGPNANANLNPNLASNVPGSDAALVNNATSPTFYEAGPSYEVGGLSSGIDASNVVNPDLAITESQGLTNYYNLANDPNIELASFRTGGGSVGNIESQLANNSNIVNASAPVNSTTSNVTAFDPGSGADVTSKINLNYSTPEAVRNASTYTAPGAGAGSATGATPYDTVLTGDRAKDFGNVLYNRFTDPRALADVAIQSAVNLIGSQVYGTEGATEQEKQLLQEQQQMLDQIKEQDKERYDFIMKQATAMFNKANNFDPSIMARAALIQQKNRNEVNRRNASRRINFRNPGLRAAEDRRFAISNAATEGSAYDRGMMAGLNTQSGLYKSAASMFPSSGGNYSSALTGLRNTYANIEKRKADQQAGLNQMFGAFGTSRPQSPYKGLTFKLV